MSIALLRFASEIAINSASGPAGQIAGCLIYAESAGFGEQTESEDEQTQPRFLLFGYNDGHNSLKSDSLVPYYRPSASE